LTLAHDSFEKATTTAAEVELCAIGQEHRIGNAKELDERR
jgi:hypothetical protein